MSSRVAVIYNPISRAPGRNESLSRRDIIRAAFGAHGVHPLWYETSEADPGYICAQQAVSRGVDVVVVAGGDGTVMSCAKALIEASVPLAIVPSGTGNVIASNLCLPTNVSDAIEVALQGHHQRIDVCISTVDCIFYSVSIGLTAAMMRDTTPKLKARLGMLAYALNAGRHLLDPPRKYSVWLDDQAPIVRWSHGVIVGNLGEVIVNPQCLQTGQDDGLIEVGVLRIRPVMDWVWRNRADRPSQRWPPVDWYQAKRIKVTCDKLQPSERDGEWVGWSSLLDIQVLARSLVVCVSNTTSAVAPRQSILSLVAQDLRRLRPTLPSWRSSPRRLSLNPVGAGTLVCR